MSTALGVDIGGTKVAVMRVDADGTIVARTRLETPQADAAATLTAVAAAASDLMDGDLAAVGVGVAAMVDAQGVARFAPNLGWTQVPVRATLEEAIGLPVLVDNDANVAAWAEFRIGAARESAHALCITVGTGIGGGLVIGGRLFRGAYGFGGEIGHVKVAEGPDCVCGSRGCWEMIASGTAIQRAGMEAVDADGSGRLAQLAGGDPARLVGSMVTDAAREGDAVATAILARVGTRLGEGIAGLINTLDPAIVVVGGGAAEAGDLLLAPARAACTAVMEAPGHRAHVPIVRAALGNDAGGVGAALLALEGEAARWETLT